jgi:hypothetical protein
MHGEDTIIVFRPFIACFLLAISLSNNNCQVQQKEITIVSLNEDFYFAVSCSIKPAIEK